MTTRIRIFYPADPLGVVPGGVDTFIRGLLRYSPADLNFSLVGMTTDDAERPLGHWLQADLGGASFRFLPVVHVLNPGDRTTIPLSLLFTWGTIRYWRSANGHFDVFDFHRIEPALLFLRDRRPKNAVFHTDMAVINSERKTDIRWRGLPRLYFALEGLVMRSMTSAWSVREQAADALRLRYPFLRDRIYYTPTWVDTDIFSPPPSDRRQQLRTEIEHSHDLSSTAFRLITVGRLDTSKDPDLLLTAFRSLVSAGADVELLYVGDGALRARLTERAATEGLKQRVRFLGLRSPDEVARLLQAADCFVLSSAYEGMPMAMLEALGSGLPAVATPVGEVAKVIVNGRNGQITRDRSPQALIDSLDRIRNERHSYTVSQCVGSISEFTPRKVLQPIYENYRRLGFQSHRHT